MLSRSALPHPTPVPMSRSRSHVPPFEVEVTSLGSRGIGVGHTESGRPVLVRAVPPGARVAVAVIARKKGELHVRRLHMVRPPADHAEPRCAQFGLCGGCSLQEIHLPAQRRAKHAWVLAEVALGPDEVVQVHPPRGAQAAYGYRNKVELSFGSLRYLSEADHAAGLPREGRFLGFHAPGRFDRVVDAPRCELIHDDMNALLGTLRAAVSAPEAAPPYDVRTHTGFWRHVALRRGERTGELLITLFTTSPGEPEQAAVLALVDALHGTPLQSHKVVGVVWCVNDGVADVARGDERQVWGRDHLHERLGTVDYQLHTRAFFQTSTLGAEVLYDTIGEALGRGGTLVDLYCGTGAIGLYLADRFDQVVGVEVIAESVEDARANAARNGIEATYHTGKVEDALALLDAVQGRRHLVVDPPRAGLHPKVAEALAQAKADTLVYVACHPGSLARDRLVLQAGGWHLTDLWTVDLFPQTGHVEAVARFERRP
jgi:23S rRNA (uracil1939-C5)-methyltransferase